MAGPMLKICAECVGKLRQNGNPQVDLVKLQLAIYYRFNAVEVSPGECRAACHGKGVKDDDTDNAD